MDAVVVAVEWFISGIPILRDVISSAGAKPGGETTDGEDVVFDDDEPLVPA